VNEVSFSGVLPFIHSLRLLCLVYAGELDLPSGAIDDNHVSFQLSFVSDQMRLDHNCAAFTSQVQKLGVDKVSCAPSLRCVTTISRGIMRPRQDIEIFSMFHSLTPTTVPRLGN